MASNYSVKVRRNDKIERVIKRFIKKTKKMGIIDEAKERRYYLKPSEKKRLMKKRSDAKRKKEEAKRKK
jgi:ribosomal protein S21